MTYLCLIPQHLHSAWHALAFNTEFIEHTSRWSIHKKRQKYRVREKKSVLTPSDFGPLSWNCHSDKRRKLSKLRHSNEDSCVALGKLLNFSVLHL